MEDPIIGLRTNGHMWIYVTKSYYSGIGPALNSPSPDLMAPKIDQITFTGPEVYTRLEI